MVAQKLERSREIFVEKMTTKDPDVSLSIIEDVDW